MHDTSLRIVRDQRRGVALIDILAIGDGSGGVVSAAAVRHATDQLILGDVEQQNVVQPLPTLGQRPVDELRLRGRAREAESGVSPSPKIRPVSRPAAML